MPRPCLWRLESPTSIIQILAEGKYFCSRGHGEELRPAGRSQPDAWPLTGLWMSFTQTPTWRSALGPTPVPGCWLDSACNHLNHLCWPTAACSPDPVHKHAAQHHMTANVTLSTNGKASRLHRVKGHILTSLVTHSIASLFPYCVFFYQLSLINGKTCLPVSSQWNSPNDSAACFSLLAYLNIYFCLLLVISISRMNGSYEV